MAVKELVENAVDAEAKTVEIRIKNFGADGFEVSDNGSGISENNFEAITAKHHTSKLKDFSDLETIKTFGFRGEALSSLCALSKVTITTRHATVEHGTKLTFAHNGEVASKVICARNVGTTVSVTDFFITLPVRRGEFLKNYKKDFNKMIQLIQEYCLVLTGVKILCKNQPPNAASQLILSTNGSSVKENIISIFGAKQAKDLIKIKSPTDNEAEDGKYTQQSLADLDTSNSVLDIKQPDLDYLNLSRFKIEGLISNIDLHCARTTKDRQYFYINSRPVELKIVSKLVNDVYHRFNMKQFPFVYLNLKMDQSTVDVNLSKDKRQVAVCNDTLLLLAVKRSLLNTFGQLPSKFKMISVNSSVKKFDKEEESEDEEDKILTLDPGTQFSQTLKQWRKTPNDPTPRHQDSQSNKRKSSHEPKGQKTPKIQVFFHQKMKEFETQHPKSSEDENSPPDDEVSFRIDCKTRSSDNTLTFETVDSTRKVDEREKEPLQASHDERRKVEPQGSIQESPEFISDDDEVMQEITTEELENTILAMPDVDSDDEETEMNSSLPEVEIIKIDSQKSNDSFKHSSKVKITLKQIQDMAKAEEKAYEEDQQVKKSMKLKLKFKEGIDPSKNKKAEAELETELKKEMFKDLEVLGQFNLGFIIAKLNSDLFIVDQHASDEKFNFETLEKTTKLQTQPLVIPEKLELTAIQEMTLIENLSVFEMNGFKFLIDESAAPGSKIKIHSKPFSKNWEFGREDIEEMIFMLDDAPNTICRPSRIRTMFASRACRKSVMIGDALTKKQMQKLLENMGQLDHPWNCPHGRPTLRYLQNLDFISDTQN